MIVVRLAVGARYHAAILAVERQAGIDVDDGASTVLARQSLLTAGHGGEDVIRIHGA